MGRVTFVVDKIGRATGVHNKGAKLDRRKLCKKVLVPGIAGFLSGAIAGGLKVYQNYVDDEWIRENLEFESTAYASFGTCLGFLVVFRTSQSYSRFWDGIDMVYAISAHWMNATSNLLTFARVNKATGEEVRSIRNLIVRMFSLLNCLVLEELEGSDVDSIRSLKYPVIDVEGIDRETLDSILNPRASSQVEQTFQMINKIVMEAMKAGVITVAPPILSRVFQEMGLGLLKHHSATKLNCVDFPAPYILALKFMLIIHMLLTPVAVIKWARTVMFSSLFTFILVFVMFGLMSLAVELDNPFLDSGFGFDKQSLQRKLNQALVTMLIEEDRGVSSLSPMAEILDDDSLEELVTVKNTRTTADGVKKTRTTADGVTPTGVVPG